MAELEGKCAVITGAGSGMGRASARAFVREGARVLGADVSGREKETAEELGDAFVPFHADVSQEADVEAMFAAALDAFGTVDAVLNVAGIGSGGRLGDATVEEFHRIMSVNLLGVMLGTKHAINTMVPSGGGVILNWSSTGGMNGTKMPTSVYCASKAGVISFTKQAAVEYGRKGIRANAICPGLTVTELSGGREAIEKFPHLVEGAPMGRAGEPEEVAELASFLASDRAPFLTGAVIPIDGGLTATTP
ncbi:MAG: SDR family oxidoreductase [Acidimicrobiales bacterium]|nr:SDR family oxidoreductase [Acidimicrobiales bacterium]